MRFRAARFLLSFFLFIGVLNAAPQPVTLPVAEQDALASRLFKEMAEAEKWDLDTFIADYKTVIVKCPDTPQAEMACWRLSNLYLTADQEPNHEGVIETLEHFTTKYPGNILYGEAKERLLISYKAILDWKKVGEMYEELFRLNPQPTDEETMRWSLGYGEALAELGKKDQAKKYFEEVLKKDNNRDSLEARVSRAKLEGMK